MERDGDDLEVEKKAIHDMGDATEICTKSCSEAYNDYEKNGCRICPHYKGKYFVEMFIDVFNSGRMESKRCMDVVTDICDLFKKDESDGK